MSEYICRESALEAVCKYCCEYDAESTECICNERLAFLKIPIADVAPVRHGRWVKIETTGLCGDPVWNCSSCGYPAGVSVAGRDYCPNCGAKMGGGADNG